MANFPSDDDDPGARELEIEGPEDDSVPENLEAVTAGASPAAGGEPAGEPAPAPPPAPRAPAAKSRAARKAGP
jgi:hypothetical protein